MPTNPDPSTAGPLVPPLLVQAGTHAIGTVHQILRLAGTLAGLDGEELVVRSQNKGRVYILPSGERLLVTNQTRCTQPPNIDGVLSRQTDGKLCWLSHNSFNEFKRHVEHGRLVERRVAITERWTDTLRYRAEIVDAAGNVVHRGLRPPQLGGLHAIGAHWTQSHQPATIVMPTGTGKTETMLAALVAYIRGPLLVVVPSQTLREQIAEKFLRLGLLMELGIIPEGTGLPLVGAVTKRPTSLADLDIFDHCQRRR